MNSLENAFAMPRPPQSRRSRITGQILMPLFIVACGCICTHLIGSWLLPAAADVVDLTEVSNLTFYLFEFSIWFSRSMGNLFSVIGGATLAAGIVAFYYLYGPGRSKNAVFLHNLAFFASGAFFFLQILSVLTIVEMATSVTP